MEMIKSTNLNKRGSPNENANSYNRIRFVANPKGYFEIEERQSAYFFHENQLPLKEQIEIGQKLSAKFDQINGSWQLRSTSDQQTLVETEKSTLEDNAPLLDSSQNTTTGSDRSDQPNLVGSSNEKRTYLKGEYRVSRIIDERGDGHEKEYQIKWVGYRSATWEPAKHFVQFPILIAEFEKRKHERLTPKAEGKKRNISFATPRSTNSNDGLDYSRKHLKRPKIDRNAISEKLHPPQQRLPSEMKTPSTTKEHSSAEHAQSHSDIVPETPQSSLANVKVYGLQRGLVPEKVLQMRPEEETVLVKYKGVHSNEWVPQHIFSQFDTEKSLQFNYVNRRQMALEQALEKQGIILNFSFQG